MTELCGVDVRRCFGRERKKEREERKKERKKERDNLWIDFDILVK